MLVTRTISATLPTGLVGTLAYQVIDSDGNQLIDSTTLGITESPTGTYKATIPIWGDDWAGTILWDDGAGHTASETFSATPAGQIALDESAFLLEEFPYANGALGGQNGWTGTGFQVLNGLARSNLSGYRQNIKLLPAFDLTGDWRLTLRLRYLLAGVDAPGFGVALTNQAGSGSYWEIRDYGPLGAEGGFKLTDWQTYLLGGDADVVIQKPTILNDWFTADFYRVGDRISTARNGVFISAGLSFDESFFVGQTPAIAIFEEGSETEIWEVDYIRLYNLVPAVTLGSAWYYATEQDVEDLIHASNTNIAFDVDDDGTIDTDAVTRAGVAMDAYIDLKLRKAQLPAPNPLTDTAAAGILKQASAHLTVWYGFHQRGLDTSSDQRLQGIAGIMEGYKAYADSLLDDLIGVLSAEDQDDEATGIGEFGFSPIVRTCVSSTDENSN